FWRRLLLGVAIAIYLLPSGPFTSALLIGGLWLFFKGQTARWSEEKWIVALVFAMVLFVSHTFMRQFSEFQMELMLVMGGNPAEMVVPAQRQPAKPGQPPGLDDPKMYAAGIAALSWLVAFF